MVVKAPYIIVTPVVVGMISMMVVMMVIMVRAETPEVFIMMSSAPV